MSCQIPPQDSGITLLGGGQLAAQDLDESLTMAPNLIGVDGGANMVLALGHNLLAVCGDLDSVSAETLFAVDPEIVIETPDQNRTDFDKALDLADAPVILCVGFTGKRMDHQLACYTVLVRQAAKPAILIGDEDICFHLSHPVTLDLPVGTRLSLFPMARVVGHGGGLRWPVDGLEFAPWGQIGTSNEVRQGPVTLSADGHGLLVILPRRYLRDVVRVLWQGDPALCP
ncbi:thiamine pyrophosphokinase [Aliiroseovarius halocynthiae]|uniref:Thiamine diphosphokinase n=1 Tax=Aliiroseovarius halocynthiae TaxID=985055 RepID=A0A545SUZ1_9RHOB|nr:thiamine diphosphokinase [Aliiroseovarius halocynthiae]TQV68783.1 thiamine diphosphokinase [Aliiroseovarius halocynthiae]SMR71208.1 thiamine pyrophosphokinase [Aliiroseovarius halocynthiae]